jgi:hypothetical protein
MIILEVARRLVHAACSRERKEKVIGAARGRLVYEG